MFRTKRSGSIEVAVAVAIAAVCLACLCAAIAHGGPFHRIHAGYAPAAYAAPEEAAGVEEARIDAETYAVPASPCPRVAASVSAPAAEKRPILHLLSPLCPCPGGKCPKDKEPVNVNVNVAPATHTAAPSPQEPPRFPWGVLLGVLIPTVLVASGIAFAVRMRAAAAADPQ